MPTRIAGFVIAQSTGLVVAGATVTPRASDGSAGTTGVTNGVGFVAIAGLADKTWIGTVAAAGQVFVQALETFVSDDIHNQSNTLSAHDIGQIRGADARIVAVSVPAITDELIYPIGDGVNVISTGVYGSWRVPVNCTVTGWTLLCELPSGGGSLVLDLWKTTYALWDAGATHPVVADTMTGSDKPTISAATKGASTALTGWTTALTAGDLIRVNVDSVTSIKLAALYLQVQRT